MNMGRIILFLLIWHTYRNTWYVAMETHVLIFSEYGVLAAVAGKKHGDPILY